MGLVYYRRLDHGKLDVLVVETADETHRFIDTDARDEFERIRQHL